MAGHQWRVLVIRAWRDGDGVRVRVLEGDRTGRQWTVASSAEAVAVVRQVIAELEGSERDDGEAAAERPSTPPDTSR